LENLGSGTKQMQEENAISKHLLKIPSRIVKRCFITGKQCIFSSLINENRASRPLEDKNLTIFVIMPLKANFETFYQWSLKPYLQYLGINENNIRKADDIIDMGYIVCEKICKKIQESDLIIADISVDNTNVFYELGLAYGLERPILLLQKENPVNNLLNDSRILNSLSCHYPPRMITRQKILKYQGLENLIEGMKKPISDYIIDPPLDRNPHKLSANLALHISLLDFSSTLHVPQSSCDPITCYDDIHLAFPQIMIGAINAAMNQIRVDILEDKRYSDSESKKLYRREWMEIEKNFNFSTNFKEVNTINIDGSQSFASISQQIESSFCTVLDVTPTNPDSILAYFWLGYCHSRGLNVIPVFKLKNRKDLREIGNRLAFDVRSLWFADYFEDEPYTFKKRIQEILEHLFLRDLPDWEKRKFWKRLPPENKLKVFTGAIHIDYLKREVVGDWDVRTVSELFSYLPFIRETATPSLITPFYSPEQAYKRFSEAEPTLTKEDFIKKFNNGISDQLKDSNAIIIASPDVNPVCEFVLNKIFQVSSSDQEYKPVIPFSECKQPDFNGYILMKKRNQDDFSKREDAELKAYEKFQRLFYEEEEIQKSDDSSQGQTRGFIKHQGTTLGKEYLEEYYSQDDKTPDNGEFKLVGHLLVAKYPTDDNGKFVIILNGVSGPATFALAQILTGGGIGSSNIDFNSASERMLYEINWRLDERPDAIGVQGLVEITVGFDQQNQNIDSITNVDIRTVKSWAWYPNHPESIFKKKTT